MHSQWSSHDVRHCLNRFLSAVSRLFWQPHSPVHFHFNRARPTRIKSHIPIQPPSHTHTLLLTNQTRGVSLKQCSLWAVCLNKQLGQREKVEIIYFKKTFNARSRINLHWHDKTKKKYVEGNSLMAYARLDIHRNNKLNLLLTPEKQLCMPRDLSYFPQALCSSLCGHFCDDLSISF